MIDSTHATISNCPRKDDEIKSGNIGSHTAAPVLEYAMYE